MLSVGRKVEFPREVCHVVQSLSSFSFQVRIERLSSTYKASFHLKISQIIQY